MYTVPRFLKIFPCIITQTAKSKGRLKALYLKYPSKSKNSKEISALVTPHVGQGMPTAFRKGQPISKTVIKAT